MTEDYCRCPGCGECKAHANEPKLKAEIRRLKAEKSKWVGLTDKEIDQIVDDAGLLGPWDVSRAVEAKLKEKNG